MTSLFHETFFLEVAAELTAYHAKLLLCLPEVFVVFLYFFGHLLILLVATQLSYCLRIG